jgi:hypothetical protein
MLFAASADALAFRSPNFTAVFARFFVTPQEWQLSAISRWQTLGDAKGATLLPVRFPIGFSGKQ